MSAAAAAVVEAPSPPPMPPPTTGPAVDAVRELLGQRVVVQTPDGRRIEGEFQCLDPQGNLILGNAYEQLQGHQLPAAQAGDAAKAAKAAAAEGGDDGQGGGGRTGEAAAGASAEQPAPQQQQPARPGERALGMVLVPREQQKEVSVLAMASQRAAIEKMVKEAVEAEEEEQERAAAAAAVGGKIVPPLVVSLDNTPTPTRAD